MAIARRSLLVLAGVVAIVAPTTWPPGHRVSMPTLLPHELRRPLPPEYGYAVPQPSWQAARPCLVNAERCIELDQAPFRPCLLSAARCNEEWIVERLVARSR